ncbi:hypothetical protein JTB14_012644 [Gonioctena quinquepunctata]|nr:hypothetical protein JTB14_012644 [Gonioctena quinquepunctata]
MDGLKQKRGEAWPQPGGGDRHRVCCQYQAGQRGSVLRCNQGADQLDPPPSAADPSTKGPQDQPMKTILSVEDESTPAEDNPQRKRVTQRSRAPKRKPFWNRRT